MAILLIEDNAIDALKIHGLLQKRGVACSLTRIQTRQALDAALQAGGIDLILADYRLTGWDGLEALRRVRAQDPDLPFIFISGEVDEPLFVEAIRGGANDFLFKDRLLRLVPAVERERLARQALRKRRALEAERRLLYQSVQQAQDWVLLTDPQGGIVHVNPMAEALTGYPPGELLGQHVRVLNSDGPDADFDRGMVDSLLVGQTWRGRLTCRRKDGSLWASLAIITPVRDERGTLTGYVGSGRMDD
jgi:PAS domain S-box-containing protein